jgi:D-xylose transport system permease protein
VGVRGAARGFLQATELDARLLGLAGALVIIWLGFNFLSDGKFLTPRNLWFLTVQTASIAIMATGMVLVIVSRNIDLSVGSMLGFIAMMMGALQTEYLPGLLGLGHPAIWIIAVVFALALGAAIGAFQGLLIAYGGIPSFIVTLGGYLVWRGAAFQVAQGKTLAPMDVTFQLVGGGAHGSIGATFTWVLAIAACVAIVLLIIYSRRRRQMFGFPLRPIWAEVLLAVLGIGAVLLGALIAVSYMWPAGIVKEWAAQNNIVIPPEGIDIPMGIAVPVLIAICVALVMTIIATRRRFGRFVFAFGGNPEAAELAGINTRRTLLKVYVLMGFLVGISACISIARLNAATNNAGQLDELYVIAAAVIGGTSFSGGIGTIVGAVLGALVMQSLQSGLILIGVDAPMQNIVAGIVLVSAVGFDTWYRRRTA